MTLAEKWGSSAAPLEVIEPERLRWMLLADQTRKVEKDGIHFASDSSRPSRPGLAAGPWKSATCLRICARSRRSPRTGGCAPPARRTSSPAKQAEAVIEQRREAAREMGRREAAASRKARARIAPLTATGTVQEITGIVADRSREPEQRDAETGELLDLLGLGDRLNKPIPPAGELES